MQNHNDVTFAIYCPSCNQNVDIIVDTNKAMIEVQYFKCPNCFCKLNIGISAEEYTSYSSFLFERLKTLFKRFVGNCGAMLGK